MHINFDVQLNFVQISQCTIKFEVMRGKFHDSTGNDKGGAKRHEPTPTVGIERTWLHEADVLQPL